MCPYASQTCFFCFKHIHGMKGRFPFYQALKSTLVVVVPACVTWSGLTFPERSPKKAPASSIPGNLSSPRATATPENANMAHLIRRRALGLALHSPPLQTRSFSHGLPRCAFNSRQQPQQPRIPSERSVRIAAKEMSQMTSDFGLLPGMPRILRMSRYNEVFY